LACEFHLRRQAQPLHSAGAAPCFGTPNPFYLIKSRNRPARIASWPTLHAPGYGRMYRVYSAHAVPIGRPTLYQPGCY
jgi:hypothetical protein